MSLMVIILIIFFIFRKIILFALKRRRISENMIEINVNKNTFKDNEEKAEKEENDNLEKLTYYCIN